MLTHTHNRTPPHEFFRFSVESQGPSLRSQVGLSVFGRHQAKQWKGWEPQNEQWRVLAASGMVFWGLESFCFDSIFGLGVPVVSCQVHCLQETFCLIAVDFVEFSPFGLPPDSFRVPRPTPPDCKAFPTAGGNMPVPALALSPMSLRLLPQKESVISLAVSTPRHCVAVGYHSGTVAVIALEALSGGVRRRSCFGVFER